VQGNNVSLFTTAQAVLASQDGNLVTDPWLLTPEVPLRHSQANTGRRSPSLELAFVIGQLLLASWGVKVQFLLVLVEMVT